MTFNILEIPGYQSTTPESYFFENDLIKTIVIGIYQLRYIQTVDTIFDERLSKITHNSVDEKYIEAKNPYVVDRVWLTIDRVGIFISHLTDQEYSDLVGAIGMNSSLLIDLTHAVFMDYKERKKTGGISQHNFKVFMYIYALVRGVSNDEPESLQTIRQRLRELYDQKEEKRANLLN